MTIKQSRILFLKAMSEIQTEVLDVGETRYIKARIRQTDTKLKISSFVEDPDVEILRQKPEISWIKQEKFKARKTRTADPEWPNLWYLNDEVSPSMKVIEAWNLGYSGKGVVIAVVDDGLQTDHPDIAANIDITNSVQIKDGKITNDPNPKFPTDRHGTRVTGLIAAVKDNNICIPGVAYSSTIIGVQLLSLNVTDDSEDTFDSDGFRTSNADEEGSIENIVDSDEASALQHNKSIVEIYSNSWGPIDGKGFEGPEAITVDVLRNGVTNGRNGKDAIYVISAGNGGIDDNCNADGYANSIYTIAITSVQTGTNANYAEVCAAALAATYGGSHEDIYLTTTDTDLGCKSDDIVGTSFSVPIASGIIAMTLEANSDLTWRDIQHLIVLTSNRNSFTDTFSGWSTNGADQEFSQILGFGLMDAEAMVSLGSKWTSVSRQLICNSITKFPNM
ncbi:furin-1-like [Mytilus trossulus]|uniref:furin-1-like n=1 Tax=Mytilus trossulus TaxID=6551 RepID=UPI0030055DF4